MTPPILFVGDMHLGRSPHRLAAAGLPAERLGPAEAWRRVVRTAIEREAQAVVLAGDVVDQDKDRFEAFGHLRRGVERLVEAGIRVVGVAGNHDHVALPRLAARIPEFTLLGQGGRWERVALEGVDLIGWSFPRRHHREDPLRSPGLAEALVGSDDEGLTLGVLHADLNATTSAYAPLRRADLEIYPVDGWFLGHVHTPSTFTDEVPIGYLGSLVGLDRSEVRRRGPWLVGADSSGALQAEQLPLGPTHWTEIEVDVSDLMLSDSAAADQIHAALASSITAAASIPWIADGDFEAVGCSVSFVGSTDEQRALRRFMDELEPHELVFDAAGASWAVVRLDDRTLVRRDLRELAGSSTPVAALARLLLALEKDGEDALPEEVRLALTRFDPSAWIADVEERPLPSSVAVARAAAYDLLVRLMEERSAKEVP